MFITPLKFEDGSGEKIIRNLFTAAGLTFKSDNLKRLLVLTELDCMVRFNNISVSEDEFHDFTKDLNEKDIYVVCRLDPTTNMGVSLGCYPFEFRKSKARRLPHHTALDIAIGDRLEAALSIYLKNKIYSVNYETFVTRQEDEVDVIKKIILEFQSNNLWMVKVR